MTWTSGQAEALAHYLQVVHEVAVVTQEDSDCLARIDDGSASERNDNVRSEVLSCGDGGFDPSTEGSPLLRQMAISGERPASGVRRCSYGFQ